jgi:hypothetical protein
MTTQKCYCAGCKKTASFGIKQMWGNFIVMPMCEEHTPDWVKVGGLKSPEMEIFGIKKSWYEIV